MSGKVKPLEVLLVFDVFPPLPETEWRKYLLSEERETERDVVKALEGLGHQVDVFGIADSLDPFLERIRTKPPERIFNLCEAVYDERAFEPDLASLFELQLLRYTGARPTALHLCKDKGLSKRIVRGAGLRTPEFHVLRKGVRLPSKLPLVPLPRIVKPLSLEGSEGISGRSMAKNDQETLERTKFLREKWDCEVIIEEYIPGREVSVGVLGRAGQLRALPPRELHLGDEENGSPSIATYKAKWDDAYRARHGIANRPADLPDELAKEISRLAIEAGDALGLSGYARIDFRIRESGMPVFLEANPNPSLARNDEFAMAAESDGIPYPELLTEILSLA